MALKFSEIELITENKSEKILVSGFVKNETELEKWTRYFDFKQENKITGINAIHYTYGDGEEFDATVEEIAYIYKRIEMNKDFLKNRCKNYGVFPINFNI